MKKLFVLFTILSCGLGLCLMPISAEDTIPTTTPIVETTTTNVETTNTEVVEEPIEEEPTEDKEILSKEDKDALADTFDYYIKLGLEYAVALLGVLSALLLVAKKVKKGLNLLTGEKADLEQAKKEFKEAQKELENAKQELVKVNEKYALELKNSYAENKEGFEVMQKMFNASLDENQDLKDKFGKANLLIARLVASNPEFASNGMAKEILAILNEGGATDDKQD